MKQSNDPTFSSADTPANHSAPQENDKVNRTHGIYGPSVSEPYAFFDPDTHCLRMCEATLVSGFPKFSQTLPASGSMQNGKLFQQGRLVHHTKGTGYLLWPTPTAHGENTATTNQAHARRLQNGMKYSSRLSQAVAVQEPTAVGYLNPTWVEWLMGFPLGWTDLKDSETL
jgi:hypothetical protein